MSKTIPYKGTTVAKNGKQIFITTAILTYMYNNISIKQNAMGLLERIG